LLSATSNAVTVKVPTFYRVIWLDAPAHAGTRNYSEFDRNDSLVATGRFSLSAETDPITGTWHFTTGSGVIRGFITNSYVVLDLRPDVTDGQYRLSGRLMENTYTGIWVIQTIVGPYSGNFKADRKGIVP